MNKPTREQYKEILFPYLQDIYYMEREFINLYENYYEEMKKYKSFPPEFRERYNNYLEAYKKEIVQLENRLRYYELPPVTKPVTNTFLPKMVQFFTSYKPTTYIEYMNVYYTIEHFRISYYRELTTLARVFDDKETLMVAERILRENIKLQRWFFEHIPEVTLHWLEYEKFPVPPTAWDFAKELEMVAIGSPYTIPTN